MITIVRTSTLAATRAQAALVPELRQAAENEAEARQLADVGLRQEQESRAESETGLAACRKDIADARAWADAAADSPSSDEMALAGYALQFLRAQIAAIIQSGDPATVERVRALSMIIGQNPDREARNSRPAAEPSATGREGNAQTIDESWAHLAEFHHPNFVSGKCVSPGPPGSMWRFDWRPFTGDEPEPEMPGGIWDRVAQEDYEFLGIEYRAARIQWAKVRFLLQAAPMLQAVAPVWRKHTTATTAMDSAFAALRNAPESEWRRLSLQLSEAQGQSQDAARAWDCAAAELRKLEWDHLRDVGEENELDLNDAAKVAGLDISTWEVDGTFAYKVDETIGHQKELLKNADELAVLRGAV